MKTKIKIRSILVMLLSLLIAFGIAISATGCGDNTDKPDGDGEVTVSFNAETDVTLNVEEQHQISVTDLVGLTVADLSYVSYNPEIASVSEGGVVTGVSEGSTKVLIKGKDERKFVNVTVNEPNKLNNVSYKKLRDIAVMPGDVSGSGIDEFGAGGKPLNIGWDGGTNASTAAKVDFENTKANSEIVIRTSVTKAGDASVDNGDFVVILSAKNSTAEMQAENFHCMAYVKTKVSSLANSFRLWAWANKNEGDIAPASGKGSFRVVAYEFNENYTSYTAHPLTATEKGSLEQDKNGWISYADVHDVVNGLITGAPLDNMFIYSVTGDDYDIRDKEIILAVEFKGVDTTTVDRFGIKRMGFILNPAPDITLSSKSDVLLYPDGTEQITLKYQGAANAEGTRYVSDNTSVATVSDSGLITAKNVTEQSECKITITNTAVEGKSVTVNVTVKPTPKTSFSVPESISVILGETAKIIPTNQIDCDEGFTFTSASQRIATVADDGTVTGIISGTTNVEVSCGGLIKNVKVVVTVNSLYGLDLDGLKAVGSLGATGGFPASLDFTWSGKTTADNISDVTTDAKIHLWNTQGSSLNDLSDPSLVNMISNIGGQGTEGIQNALYFKCNTPAAANEFRVWIRSNEALTDISNVIYFRVVIYILNEEQTAYVPHILNINIASAADAVMTQDAGSGIITLNTQVADNFVNFIPSADVLGKNDAIISVETFADTSSDLQSRAIVRRLGFDA